MQLRVKRLISCTNFYSYLVEVKLAKLNACQGGGTQKGSEIGRSITFVENYQISENDESH